MNHPPWNQPKIKLPISLTSVSTLLGPNLVPFSSGPLVLCMPLQKTRNVAPFWVETMSRWSLGRNSGVPRPPRPLCLGCKAVLRHTIHVAPRQISTPRWEKHGRDCKLILSFPEVFPLRFWVSRISSPPHFPSFPNFQRPLTLCRGQGISWVKG